MHAKSFEGEQATLPEERDSIRIPRALIHEGHNDEDQSKSNALEGSLDTDDHTLAEPEQCYDAEAEEDDDEEKKGKATADVCA